MTANTATQTEARSHVQIAEMQEEETGYRYWTGPMGKQEMESFLENKAGWGVYLSDMTCHSTCWCQ